jgi:hypothetical protein
VYRSKGYSSHHILLVSNLRRKSLRGHGKDLPSLLCGLSKALWVSVSRIHLIYFHYSELSLQHSKGAGVLSQSLGSPPVCPSVCHLLLDTEQFTGLSWNSIEFFCRSRHQARVIYTNTSQWQSQFTCLRVGINFSPTFYISWQIRVKYGMEHRHTFSSRLAKPREKRYWGRHTLRKGLNVILPILAIFSSGLHNIRQKISSEMYWKIEIFIQQIDPLKRVKIKFRCGAIYSTAALSAYCTLDPQRSSFIHL